jgi:hypothetical protein
MSQETPRPSPTVPTVPTVPNAPANTRTRLYGSAVSIRCRSYTLLEIKRMTHDYLPDFCFLVIFDIIGHSGRHYHHVITLKSNLVYFEVRVRCLSRFNEPISTYRRYRIVTPEVYTSKEHLYEWEDRGECSMSGIARRY